MLPESLQTETNKLPSTLTPEQQRDMREYLDRCNTEMLFNSAKKQKTRYIQNMIALYSPEWWDEWRALKDSDIPEFRKVAFQEFNKLQLKKMPTEISGIDGSPIEVNIINYQEQSATPTPEAIEAEIITDENGSNSTL